MTTQPLATIKEEDTYVAPDGRIVRREASHMSERERSLAASLAKEVKQERNDNRMYYVERHGRMIKRYWSELSRTEKVQQIQAERRAAYVEEFNIFEIYL